MRKQEIAEIVRQARSDSGRHAAKARWAKTTEDERSRIMRRVARARWGKRRARAA